MADDVPTRFGETTTRDRIKLPLWAWAVVGGLGVGGLYLWWRSRQASSANQAAADASATQASSAGYSTPTTILPIYNGSAPTVDFPLQQYENPPVPAAGYTVTGTTKPSDQYPGGIAEAIYGVKATDAVDLSVFTTLILLLNPTLSVPYPIGTNIRVPAWPGDPHTKAYSASSHPDNTKPPAQLSAPPGAYLASPLGGSG